MPVFWCDQQNKNDMSKCVQNSAVNELAQSTLQSFEERVSKLRSDQYSGFHAEARTLEAQLSTIHKLVSICARDEGDLDNVSELWGLMVTVCDSFSQRLGRLKDAHPNCGADVYYDRILDLRNKCVRLRDMHAA